MNKEHFTETSQVLSRLIDLIENEEAEANVRRFKNQILPDLDKNASKGLGDDLKGFFRYLDHIDITILSLDITARTEQILGYATWLVDDKEYKRNTVKKRLSGLRKTWSLMGLSNPLAQDVMANDKLALILRRAYARADQVKGVSAPALAKITLQLAQYDENVRYKALRDVTLINVGYDTMLRRSELVSLRIEDLDFEFNNVIVNKTKTNTSGEGELKHLTRTSIGLIERLLGAMGEPNTGFLFRPAATSGKFKATELLLDEYDVPRIYRALYRQCRLNPSGISGHSPRVGACQKMFEEGVPMPKIMMAGGWKSAAMPMRYGEKFELQSGASANIAEIMKR
jgi:integrase